MGVAWILIVFTALGSLPTYAASEWPVFQEFRKKAFDRSPELNVLRAQYSQKRAHSYTALTRWMPAVNLQFSQARSKDFSIITGGALGPDNTKLFKPQEVDLSRWTVVMNMPIYKRDVHTQLMTSWADSDWYELQLEAQETELDWRLRQLLGQYLLQQYKVWSTHQALELGNNQLREVKLRFDLGDKTKLDVLRAQVNLSALETKKSTFEQEKKDALSRFAEYMGVSETEILDKKEISSFETGAQILQALDSLMLLSPVQEKLSSVIHGPSIEVEKNLAHDGPRYLAAVREESLALKRSQQLMSEEFPDLALQGNVNKQGKNWDDTFKEGNRSYSIAVVLTVPIFAGGRFFSNWSESSQAARAAELQSDKNRERIKNEVKNRLSQAQSQEKNVYSLGIQLEQQQEIARLTKKSYELGKSNMSDLLSSQNDLLQSQIDLAQAKVQLAILLRQVAWDLGVTL